MVGLRNPPRGQVSKWQGKSADHKRHASGNQETILPVRNGGRATNDPLGGVPAFKASEPAQYDSEGFKRPVVPAAGILVRQPEQGSHRQHAHNS
jgi:hypothetical protein